MQASGSTAPSLVAPESGASSIADRLVACARSDDVRGFLAALREVIASAGFNGARQELTAASADPGCSGFGSFALRCLVACHQIAGDESAPNSSAEQSERQIGPVEALLADLGPSLDEQASVDLPPAALEAFRSLVSDRSSDLKVIARAMRAWKVPTHRCLPNELRSCVAVSIVERSRSGAVCGAAHALTLVPDILERSEAAGVMEAVDTGNFDDVAERLAKALGLEAHLVQHRQKSERLKSAAKAVKAFGLEAEFPDAEFDWKCHALKSAAKHGSREAAIGLSSNDPRLFDRCVKSLLEMGEAWLAIEMADAWNVSVTTEVRNAGLEARALAESKHLRLPHGVEVVVVDSEALVPPMRDVLLQAPVVGLDAEWSAAQGSPASLLQLAAAESVFLIDLLSLGTSAMLGGALTELVTSNTVKKVGFGGSKDLSRVAGSWPTLGGCARPSNYVDLQEVAALRRMQEEGVAKKKAKDGLSLASVVQRYMGLPLDKTMQLSEWARRPLSPAQQHYAALDAWAPLQVIQILEGSSATDAS